MSEMNPASHPFSSCYVVLQKNLGGLDLSFLFSLRKPDLYHSKINFEFRPCFPKMAVYINFRVQ